MTEGSFFYIQNATFRFIIFSLLFLNQYVPAVKSQSLGCLYYLILMVILLLEIISWTSLFLSFVYCFMNFNIKEDEWYVTSCNNSSCNLF